MKPKKVNIKASETSSQNELGRTHVAQRYDSMSRGLETALLTGKQRVYNRDYPSCHEIHNRFRNRDIMRKEILTVIRT